MSFSKPSAPIPAPEPPPVVEDTEAKSQDYASMLRKRKGRAAAVLSERGAAAPETAAKTLLGS